VWRKRNVRWALAPCSAWRSAAPSVLANTILIGVTAALTAIDPVVAVGHVDVGGRSVAAELDVLGQAGQAPHAASAHRLCGLEVQV
jgi:hypothetical protein